jgi:phage terminase small subunit
MAGAPGRSGGARAGAGRKPKPIVRAEVEEGADMLQFLQDVALGRVEANATQVRAAVAAVQYTHTKRHDGGKRDEQAERAKKVSAGKFAAAAPPRLVVNNQ